MTLGAERGGHTQLSSSPPRSPGSPADDALRADDERDQRDQRRDDPLALVIAAVCS
jgi:hypothetical protein